MSDFTSEERDSSAPRSAAAAAVDRRTVLRGVAVGGAGIATALVSGCGSSTPSGAAGAPGARSSRVRGGAASSGNRGGGGPGGRTGGGTSGEGNAGAGTPTVLGGTSDVPVGSGAVFPAQQVVVTQPSRGTFKGFSGICTHLGCPLSDVTATINCNCHGSAFSITDGSVVNGPATRPLPGVAVKVDGSNVVLG